MIWESRYWKYPLLEAAEVIEAAIAGPLPDEDELGCLEYLIMTGFFSIRKLIEAQTKVSEATEHLFVELTRYAIYGTEDQRARRPNLMNRHQVDQLYDFAKSHVVNKGISYVSNQFVHSYIFNFEIDENSKLHGVLLASDKDKDKFCNLVTLADIAEVFVAFGTDCLSELHMQRDENGELKTIKKC